MNLVDPFKEYFSHLVFFFVMLMFFFLAHMLYAQSSATTQNIDIDAFLATNADYKELVGDGTTIKSGIKKQLDKEQKKSYLAQKLLVKSQKYLLKREYGKARKTINDAFLLTPKNPGIIYVNNLVKFPAIKIGTSQKIFSVKQAQYMKFKVLYERKDSITNWVKNWTLNILDQNEQVIHTMGANNLQTQSIVWDGLLQTRQRAKEGKYGAELLLNGDLNCQIKSPIVGFSIFSTPPEIVLSASNGSFLPGSGKIVLNIENKNNEETASWNISILDSIGTTIFETNDTGAMGTQFVWDGRTTSGEYVEQGSIYTARISGSDKTGKKWKSNDETIKALIEVIESKKEITFEISSIYFATAKSMLKSESIPVLRMVVDLLKKYPDYTVEVIGHTDDVGSEENNLSLSKSRAIAVVEFINKNIINTGRIFAEGHGESEPIASNETKDGRSKNRRVEFSLKKEK